MRILIIEDELEIAKFLKSGLEAEFFIVDLAPDGEKGSFMARTNEYDLIIVDYILPKMNGREVVKEIKKDKKDVCIMMLTVKGAMEQKVDLFELGVDDYVTKPFVFEELLCRIKAVLRRPKKIEKSILKIDDLIVDADCHLVKRGKKAIYLTRKELALLEYMLRNRGRVLSRSMILEHVWDINADPFSNTIESHILNLRKKINLNRKKELIHTIPGRGYKLDLKK